MADSKITALAALTTADPANDMFPVVDVSDTSMAASGTTKRISINNILACSPSATLASATITGDLTVDTSTLKVDSTNNRVIVGHTSGASAFQVSNAGAAGFEVQPTGVNSAPAILSYNRSTSAWIQLTYGALSHVWQNSGTDAMTLNSTGLGVGVTPAVRFDSLVADAVECARFRAASGWLRIYPYVNATDVCRLQSVNNTNSGLQTLTLEGLNLRFNTNTGNAVIIDNLGNTISNVNSAVPSLATNSQMVFNLTSNTNLRISVRGADGTTRTANITLA